MTKKAAKILKPKKSVALSGTVAGNTALCTVGLSGNDLHYRGYNILDIADICEFEEIAYLIVHGKLPTITELASYKNKLRSLRGLPEIVKVCLEQLPSSTRPMESLLCRAALSCQAPLGISSSPTRTTAVFGASAGYPGSSPPRLAVAPIQTREIHSIRASWRRTPISTLLTWRSVGTATPSCSNRRARAL